MPEIKFFSEAGIKPGYEEFVIAERLGSDSITLGNWRFYLTKIKPVSGPLTPGGIWGTIGYEETYTNDSISQHETNVLMQKYREETGQAK